MCNSNFNPIKCIIPPYIANKLKKQIDIDGVSIDRTNEIGERRFRNKRKALSNLSNRRRSAMAGIMDAPDPELLEMQIYDAGQLPILPGDLVWQTGDGRTRLNRDVRNVLIGGEKTWGFYKTLFDRNSLDNQGMLIQQSVHYREDPRLEFANAFWDGSQMIYGDGDVSVFASFTSDLDIIAHELTHAVIDYEANLTYKNQSGALNESMADVFGILVKQWTNKTLARKSNWLIGDKILRGRKYALRSMKAPGYAYIGHPELGDDPQPAVMSDYMEMEDDDGGVHYNSGIPNYAFYVAAYEMGGHAWEKAGKIWYAALTDKSALRKNSSFSTARQATLAKARLLFGNNSREMKAVKKGWDAAEVD